MEIFHRRPLWEVLFLGGNAALSLTSAYAFSATTSTSAARIALDLTATTRRQRCGTTITSSRPQQSWSRPSLQQRLVDMTPATATAILRQKTHQSSEPPSQKHQKQHRHTAVARSSASGGYVHCRSVPRTDTTNKNNNFFFTVVFVVLAGIVDNDGGSGLAAVNGAAPAHPSLDISDRDSSDAAASSPKITFPKLQSLLSHHQRSDASASDSHTLSGGGPWARDTQS